MYSFLNLGLSTWKSITLASLTSGSPSFNALCFIVSADKFASSSLNCSDTAFLDIPYVEGLTYYIPNTFTPDGDLFNQTFKPVFTSGFDPNQFSMKIFNRWGEIIFESRNAQIGWDGTYGINGNKVPEGSYTYHITYKIPNKDERRIVTGHVTLLK